MQKGENGLFLLFRTMAGSRGKGKYIQHQSFVLPSHEYSTISTRQFTSFRQNNVVPDSSDA